MITRTGLDAALRSVVETDRHQWKQESFERAINAAIRAVSETRRNHRHDTLHLVAGVREYRAPDDLINYIASDWGDKNVVVHLRGVVRPRIFSTIHNTQRMIEFSFPPNNPHLAAFGSEFNYHYSSLHTVPLDELDETPCTVRLEDYDLLYTWALAILMLDLVAANVTDPVQMHRGMGATVDYSGTPQKAYGVLMNHYKEIARP